jgi:uroporphyrinogen-III synthase
MKIKRKKIFISRDLEPDSCLHQLSPQFELISKSMLEFTYLDIDNIYDTDWYFFYSKNGVKSFQSNATKFNFNFSHKHKIAAIGESTAVLFSKLFKKEVDYIVKEKDDSEFLNIIGQHTITFVQAKDSLKRFQNLVSEKSKNILITYEAYVNQQNPKIEADYYIFTSPKNVSAFFDFNSLSKGSTVIAIGNTTATALSKRNIFNVKIPIQPSEQSLLLLISELV